MGIVKLIEQILTSYQFINSIGLFFDVCGILLIWKYGLPNKEPGRDQWGYSGGPEEIEEKQKYKRRSRFGLILILIGFCLQALSNFSTPIHHV